MLIGEPTAPFIHAWGVRRPCIKAGKVESGATIKPWDWFYYAEKVRKAKYDLDEEITKPYFKMENVREGVFNNASRLYGLKFKKIENAPVYNPDVEAFEVTDSDGSLIGVLTTDYFPRESKRGGAWMNNIREQYVTADGKMRLCPNLPSAEFPWP